MNFHLLCKQSYIKIVQQLSYCIVMVVGPIDALYHVVQQCRCTTIKCCGTSCERFVNEETVKTRQQIFANCCLSSSVLSLLNERIKDYGVSNTTRTWSFTSIFGQNILKTTREIPVIHCCTGICTEVLLSVSADIWLK